jgi:hypothetical protein
MIIAIFIFVSLLDESQDTATVNASVSVIVIPPNESVMPGGFFLARHRPLRARETPSRA